MKIDSSSGKFSQSQTPGTSIPETSLIMNFYKKPPIECKKNFSVNHPKRSILENHGASSGVGVW